MAKYRGKHNNRTRGPYIRKAFVYHPPNEKELFDLFKQIEHYLSDSGYFINGSHCNEKEYSKTFNSYHMAGATIGLTSMRYKIKTKHYISMIIVSNDTLDDIVQKITYKFPFLSE